LIDLKKKKTPVSKEDIKTTTHEPSPAEICFLTEHTKLTSVP